MEVTVYSTPTCPYCRLVKQLLLRRGIPFKERDVSRDPEAAQELVNTTKQRTVPVTVIDGQVIIGYDRARLEEALSQIKPAFGAMIADAATITARRGLGVRSGAYVGGVRTGSVAAAIGLAKDDIIVELNGVPIATAADLQSALSHLNKGSRFSLVALRGTERIRKEGGILVLPGPC